jgi:hypothetical protein
LKKTKIANAAELPAGLLGDIHSLITETRRQTVAAVNVGLTLLYWRIGQRIRSEVLGDKRADYGAGIVVSLSRQLTSDYGRSFSDKNLRHMMRFAESFPDEAIVSTLSRQLGWSHFLEILYLKDAIKRDFYAEMCGMLNIPDRRYAEHLARIGCIPYTSSQQHPPSLSTKRTRRVIFSTVRAMSKHQFEVTL